MSGTSPILVTGGTGFIGRQVVRELLARGVRPRLFCRSVSKARRLFGDAVELVEGDLLESAAVRQACLGVSRVVHLGGLYEFGPAARHELYRVNVEGTRNVLEGCRVAQVQRLLHCSTAGILGVGRVPIGETDFPARPPRGCAYKGSKWEAERLVLNEAPTGLEVVVVSPTAPIGAGDERPTPTGRMVLDLLRGRFPAVSRTGLNLGAVEDVAAGIVKALERGEPSKRYLLGGEDVWLSDFLKLVAGSAGRRPPRWVVPWPLVALGGLTGELAGRAFGLSNSRLCWETAVFARQRQFFDLGPTQRALGWRALKRLPQAVADTVAWFRSDNRWSTETDSPSGQKGDRLAL